MSIKPSSIPKQNERVKTASQEAFLKDKEIIFSFRYLNLNHKKFNCNGKGFSYFNCLIERLRDVSQIRVNDIGAKGKTLRCHSIDWKDTTETCFGIPNE